MLESIVERHNVKFAKKKGWLVFKGKAPGVKGFHDRIHFKSSFCFTTEYKKPKKKATDLQIRRAKELFDAGIVSRCFDNIEDATDFIILMTNIVALPHEKAYNRYIQLLDLSTFYME